MTSHRGPPRCCCRDRLLGIGGYDSVCYDEEIRREKLGNFLRPTSIRKHTANEGVVTVRFVPNHVRSALEVVMTEHERTAAERDAFAQFTDQIADLDTSADTMETTPTQPAATQTLLQPDSQMDTQLADVRTAYRETVMSVPHYAEEYDESLQEHLTAEFSPEIATTLTTSDQFLPSLQEHLITENHQACESRTRLLSALEDEASALQAADERLIELGSEFSDLLAAHSLEAWSSQELLASRQQVRASERECEELAADRQSTLRGQRITAVQHIDLEFTDYLYRSLSVAYPVLADITNLAETLRSTRSQIDDELDLQ